MLPPEVALAAADGYLRNEYRIGHSIDMQGVAEWQASVFSGLRKLRGESGVRAAGQTLALADPRKDSVLESVSHLQLHRLGIDVAVQVVVPARNRGNYYVDFELLGLGILCECDGKVKYTNSNLGNGLSVEEQLYREKRREEWIAGSTGKRIVRWGYQDVRSPISLAQLLASYGVPIPNPP